MDQKVEIKEEPVWLDGTTIKSLDNFELESSMIRLKEETKPELLKPGPTQNATDIKDEIIVEEHKTDELVPHLKEENSMQNVAVSTMHTGGNVQCCKVCSMMFSQECNLEKRMLAQSREGLYVCDPCITINRQKNSLKQYLRLHSEEIPCPCKEFNEVFVQRCDLKSQVFECEVCNRTFTRASNKRAHMVVHTGDRPFECKHCNRRFTLKGNLLRHHKTHNADRPYRCKKCERSFRQRIHLQTHMIIHTGKRPFNCKDCNKTFNRLSNFRTHMEIHRGHKPFQCEDCHHTFTRLSNLRDHMEIHIGHRPYQCNECNGTFTLKVNLQRHMLVHTAQRL